MFERIPYEKTVRGRIECCIQDGQSPKNAIIFCLITSISGLILGREALGRFVDMLAIGASTGFFFTSASDLRKMRQDKDATTLRSMTILGMVF